jgi:hypothetical protein
LYFDAKHVRFLNLDTRHAGQNAGAHDDNFWGSDLWLIFTSIQHMFYPSNSLYYVQLW